MRTRGFEVLEWSHRYLPSPSDPSQPLVFSDEQARFVLAFYEVDEGGAYLYRRGAPEAAKGWGAVLALAEFAGPVAAPVPWVQIAACSEDQATSNVYSLVWALLAENDAKAARELGIDLGRNRLYLKDAPAAKLEAVTSAWGRVRGSASPSACSTRAITSRRGTAVSGWRGCCAVTRPRSTGGRSNWRTRRRSGRARSPRRPNSTSPKGGRGSVRGAEALA